jgi:hypothetical protein
MEYVKALQEYIDDPYTLPVKLSNYAKYDAQGADQDRTLSK